MIYKHFRDTKVFKSPTNTTYEYNIEDKDINYCVVDIDGRFPLHGYAVNRICKEMAHILSGSGKLMIDGESYDLQQDDVVLIEPNERYYWEGKMRLGLPCSPAWYPEQHEEID